MRICGDSDVGDLRLVTIVGCWCQNFDVVDIFGVMVPRSCRKIVDVGDQNGQTCH